MDSGQLSLSHPKKGKSEAMKVLERSSNSVLALKSLASRLVIALASNGLLMPVANAVGAPLIPLTSVTCAEGKQTD